VRWTSTAAVSRTLLQIVQVAILARILAPEDYGLMAIVTVVLSFAGIFTDLGVNSAYVQRQWVTQEQRSSLFWLNVSMGVGITLLVIVSSSLIARFFDDVRLTPLIMLSAMTFVLGALGQQVRMSAEKALEFRAVATLEIAAVFIGFVSAVLAALGGWGVYSLVVSGIISALTATVFAWLFVARGWRPMWRLRIEDIKPFLAFGGAMVGNNIVNQVNITMDVFLGGRMLAATQLGLYSVPRNLVFQVQGMVNPIITRVGFPLIAQVQSDVVRVRSIYLKTLNMTASANAPLYIAIAFFAPEIITILLGSGWERSGGLLRILALWGVLRATFNPVGSLLYGVGRVGLALKWNLGLLLVIPPVLWTASQEGPEGIAWALLILYVGLFIPGWYYLVRPTCHASLLEYSISALKPFVLSGLSVAPAFLLATQFESVVLRLLIGVVVAAPLYLVISYIYNREWVLATMELIGRRTLSAQK